MIDVYAFSDRVEIENKADDNGEILEVDYESDIDYDFEIQGDWEFEDEATDSFD